MSTDRIVSATEKPIRKYKHLRVWPVFILLLSMLGLFLTRFIPAVSDSDSIAVLVVSMMGPMLIGVLILLWWLGFSRATWQERLVGFLGVIAIAAIVMFTADQSVLGPAIMIATIPMGLAGFGIGALTFGRLRSFKRTLVALLIATCGFGFTTLIRSNGLWGNGKLDWGWRWINSPEEALLAHRALASKDASLGTFEIESALESPEWPRFRGADRNGRSAGADFSTNWLGLPPEKVWTTSVGPGWSSFVVAGKLLFTQEQHGVDEAVVCYNSETGQVVWTQKVESRFNDPIGGPGPRATPTLADGGLFVQGAQKMLHRLDPKTGDVVWAVNVAEIAERVAPTWGFSSSPLVVDSTVVVHVGGEGDKGTLGFDIETGALKWSAPAGDHSYSSPDLFKLNGKQYVSILTNAGLNLLDPVSGEMKLDYQWKCDGYRALQPQVYKDSILLPTQTLGTRRIQIIEDETELSAKELWTSRFLKPDFNDFVIQDQFAYGFDGKIFTCIDLETGERKWKRGRYGKGQVLLLVNSKLLLVLSEQGDLVLLKADPLEHIELAAIAALEGRTWNHPVVVGDKLYVRNGEKAICYRLPIVDQQTAKPTVAKAQE